MDLSPDKDVPGTVRCLICLNALSGQPVATPQQCEHQYCLACITEWAKMTNSCPVDRLEFSVLYQRTCVGGGIQKIVKVELPQSCALKQDTAEELSVCEACGRSDRRHLMLLCSGCDSRYHIGCLSPPLSTVPFEDWFCEECATESSHTDGDLSTEEGEIDEAEIMDLLAEAVPTSSSRSRRNERVCQQNSHRHKPLSQPFQHVPKYLLKSTSSSNKEDKKYSQTTEKPVTYKRKRRRRRR